MTQLDPTLQMFKDLTDANGIAGNERAPREVMKKYIAPYADSVETDNLGSVIAKKWAMKMVQKLWWQGI